MSDTQGAPRSHEDQEYAGLLKQAELGQLGPEGFERAEQLLPHVSENLHRMPGKQK